MQVPYAEIASCTQDFVLVKLDFYKPNLVLDMSNYLYRHADSEDSENSSSEAELYPNEESKES